MKQALLRLVGDVPSKVVASRPLPAKQQQQLSPAEPGLRQLQEKLSPQLLADFVARHRGTCLRRVETSGLIVQFVQQCHGNWQEQDWQQLLKRLETDDFYPINEEHLRQAVKQVGLRQSGCAFVSK